MTRWASVAVVLALMLAAVSERRTAVAGIQRRTQRLHVRCRPSLFDVSSAGGS